MDINILQNAAQLAPGFIGVALNKLMIGDIKDEQLNTSVLKYFLYMGASWLATQIMAQIGALADFTVSEPAMTTMAIITAALLGILWPSYLCRKSVDAANAINTLFGKNKIFLSESVLEKIHADNEAHYYEVYRAGKLVAAGWCEHCDYSERAFSLRKIEGYEAGDMQEVRNIVWQKEDMILKEYAQREENDE